MASKAKAAKKDVPVGVNMETCDDSSQMWVLKLQQLNEFFRGSMDKNSWEPTEDTLLKFRQHLVSHRTTFGDVQGHQQKTYETLMKTYNPNVSRLIAEIRKMVDKLNKSDEPHPAIVQLLKDLDTREDENGKIKVDLEEDPSVQTAGEDIGATWDQWLEHVKAKSINGQFLAVIKHRNAEMETIEKTCILFAPNLVPLSQEMRDDFLKHMNTFRENIAGKRVTQESEKYEADIKKWIDDGKKEFAASNTELLRLIKRADDESLRLLREKMKGLVDQMNERLEKFQAGEYVLDEIIAEFRECNNSLDRLRGEIQQMDLPPVTTILKEREAYLKQAGEIIAKAQKYALVLIKDKAKEAGSTELDTGDLPTCLRTFEEQIGRIKRCTDKVGWLQQQSDSKKLHLNDANKAHLGDAREALLSAQAQLEKRLMQSLKADISKESEPFTKQMGDLQEEGKYKEELLTEFPTHSKYGEFLDSAEGTIYTLGMNLSDSNKDLHVELKALQETSQKAYNEAKKAYDKMLEEKIKKEIAEKIGPIREEAKTDFKEFKEHISAVKDGEAFPGEETLNSVKGKLDQHIQKLGEIEEGYDSKYHNIINKARNEIVKMEPETVYRKAKEDFLTRERKTFAKNAESVYGVVKDKVEVFDVDMSGKKRDKADPEDKALEDIQSELDKAISDIQNMNDFDDDENKKTAAHLVTDITHMKEKVKQLHQEAYTVHLENLGELEKEKEEFLESLRVKSSAVDGPKATFIELLENVKNSHTEDAKHDIMLQQQFDETMKAFDECQKTLKQIKPPRDSLKGDLQSCIDKLLKQKQECQTVLDEWKNFNDTQGNYSPLKYTLSDCKCTVDVLQQDAETGVVCVVKAGEMSRETLTCNTVDLQAFNTRGLELISNVVEVTANHDVEGPLWIALPYEIKSPVSFKEPQVNMYNPDKMEWAKIKSTKAKDQSPSLMETRVKMKTGVPLYIAVTYDTRISVHLLGTKSETIVSPYDKKLKIVTGVETFRRKTTMSLKATPLSINHHLVVKKLLELPNEMPIGTSPILEVEVGELPSDSINLTVPLTGNTEEQNSKKTSRHVTYPENNYVSHLMLGYRYEGWKAARRIVDSKSKNDSTFNLSLKTSEFHQKRLTGLVIKTTPTTNQKTLCQIADELSRSIHDYYGRFILRQLETDKKQMHMALCHRTHVDKMNTDAVLTKLGAEQYTLGPAAPSKEFHMKEGDRFEVYMDKNISFASGGDLKSLIFHSQLPSSTVKAGLTYKDPYAQHSYNEYQGSVICCRKEASASEKMQICGEEICKFSVSVPKEILSRDRTFIQAKNTNGLLTNDLLRDLSAALVPHQEEFYKAYGVENKHVEKLKQKYPEDPEEQVFNMFRDVMKAREVMGRENIAKEIVKTLAKVNVPEAENMLKTRVNGFFQEQDKKKQDDRMRQSVKILKDSPGALKKWREIYRSLMAKFSESGAIESDIKEIETQENSEKGQMEVAMSKWREYAGTAVSGRVLFTTLNKLKLKKEAERINDVWGAWTE